jgi:hypothetical protein
LAEQIAVEQEAWGEIRALLEELAVVVVAVAVLVGVVTVAVMRGKVGVGIGGMGLQGRLRGPQPECSGRVGAVHGGGKGVSRRPPAVACCFRGGAAARGWRTSRAATTGRGAGMRNTRTQFRQAEIRPSPAVTHALFAWLIRHQHFSLRTNQPLAISQQYSFL